ncbi:MAG: DUF2764 domain-containing protein [Bacteroidales bacterium]|nr:DUF2764 domain-containing protein [Bacteroidales bacterium]
MSNFEYIISSLPWLTADYKYAGGQGFSDVIAEIKDNLGEKDSAVLDFLLKGFQPESLDQDFYTEALAHPCKYIREYFRFDLNLRNAKVRYLNRQLKRDPETDVLTGEASAENESKADIDGLLFSPGEFEEAAPVEAVLEGTDLIAREKGLDDIVWKKADTLSTFHYFDITAVLAYVTKLHIADRWLILDEEQGRELFRKLVQEVRGTYKGVKYQEQ